MPQLEHNDGRAIAQTIVPQDLRPPLIEGQERPFPVGARRARPAWEVECPRIDSTDLDV